MTKFSIEITSLAEQDMRKVFIWYEEQSAKVGLRFEKEVEQLLQTIVENPLKFQIKYNSIRVAYLKRFPVGLHFSVSSNTILIIACFHTSQNPERWKRR